MQTKVFKGKVTIAMFVPFKRIWSSLVIRRPSGAFSLMKKLLKLNTPNDTIETYYSRTSSRTMSVDNKKSESMIKHIGTIINTY